MPTRNEAFALGMGEEAPVRRARRREPAAVAG